MLQFGAEEGLLQGQAKKMGGLGSETLNSKAILLIFFVSNWAF